METQKRKLVVGQWMKKDLCCCDSGKKPKGFKKYNSKDFQNMNSSTLAFSSVWTVNFLNKSTYLGLLKKMILNSEDFAE